jgi:hypothetical protein
LNVEEKMYVCTLKNASIDASGRASSPHPSDTINGAQAVRMFDSFCPWLTCCFLCEQEAGTFALFWLTDLCRFFFFFRQQMKPGPSLASCHIQRAYSVMLTELRLRLNLFFSNTLNLGRKSSHLEDQIHDFGVHRACPRES